MLHKYYTTRGIYDLFAYPCDTIMEAAKRARFEEAPGPKEEKEPTLKCHEMRLIFQRLPTSELICFISNLPEHPLGKFWSQELKFVVEKRLPFSIKATATSLSEGAPSGHVIYDCNGSRVAEIKRPEHFHASPICELIEDAEVPIIAWTASGLSPRFAFPTPDILSNLANLDSLTLSVYYFSPNPKLQGAVDLPAALNPVLMLQVKSLALANRYADCEAFEKQMSEVLTRAPNLKKLNLPSLNQSFRAWLDASPNGLESLRIREMLCDRLSMRSFFDIVTTRFVGLRELFLPVRGPIHPYLAACLSLPSLATLGLAALPAPEYAKFDAKEQERSIDETDAPIVSVTELFIASNSSLGNEPQASLALLSRFPNVQTFSADFYPRGRSRCRTTRRDDFLLNFASTVCSSGVFSHLRTLRLFAATDNTSVSSDALLQFIRANIDHLPSSVDLSQVKTARPTTVDRDFLVDLCLALQGGRVTSLSLKDFIHREAVFRLREHFAMTKQQMARTGKVLAWIDEGSIDQRRNQAKAAWWPKAISDFTDFRIEACKTSGPLKGSAFKVRVSNWTEKRKRLFDDKLI